ncbi:DUF4011 domain-containing protein [Solimicrobium silvestre]|uniref:AAA domain n=1 Tax=Solimicrobium silvestre TaxID=2099400 RepID=A0A2S9GSN1_9BURK|nr:DUF4011 domain-containing protein [Solimicrobium silvestre]PRC90729.1 hypothetical protein S2091_4555 [Solimicrobium silvestre]
MLDAEDLLSKTNSSENKKTFELKVEIISSPTVSYAAIQNRVPIIQKILIENNFDHTLKNVDLVISSNPPFMLGQRFQFERLLAGESRTIGVELLDIHPDHNYFSELNEAELGHIEAKATAEDDSTAHSVEPIEMLAFNEWGGTKGLPELLAAFVQPNSISIDRILGLSSEILRNSNAALSMDGYQSKNRERVWKQVNAIFNALISQEIKYAPPPASFETAGQKIRTTERILDGLVSTCLDSAILMAACFEQAGLNPVVFLNKGHAWVGVWLIDTCFPTSIIDSVQSVRKRVDSGELLMLEATAISQNSRPSMQWSRITANVYIEEDSTTFTYAVDIKRARQAHIRSLKEKNPSIDQEKIVDENEGNRLPSIEAMPSLPPLDPGLLPITDVGSVDTPQGRLIRWRGKLLDLTLRNKLLNFKPGKTFLKIVCSDAAKLEDTLCKSNEFRLSGKPTLMEDGDPRSAEIYLRETGMSVSEAHANTTLLNNELVFDVPLKEFDGRLTDIFRAGKNTLEETGANTLYISIGMLDWKEALDSESTLKAPLILVPITLKRGAVGAGIKLVRHDDETIFNPTLLQKLMLDFEINLPFSDGQLPTDESGVDVSTILQQVRMAVADLKGFEVRTDCFLGNFSFTKYVMWKDLTSRVDDLSKSQIVNHLINNTGQAFIDGAKSISPSDLDTLYSPQSLFTPLIADSSQLAVVCTATNGKNIVVEGPPGTGKSQTITNMISHYLANDKTVLFVAEKMAALEVVHKRLTSLGLADFCLELHSSKAKKSEIAKEFVQTLNISQHNLQSDWLKEAEKLSVIRNQLTDLVNVLHREHRNGLSVFDSMGSCIGNSDRIPAQFNWADADTHSNAELESLYELVAEMSALARHLGNIGGHPLSEIGQTKWTPSWQDDLIKQCESIESAIVNLKLSISDFSKLLNVDVQTLSFNDLISLDQLAEILMQSCEIPFQSVSFADNQIIRKQLNDLIAHGINRNDIWTKFEESYVPDLKSISAEKLQSEWRVSNQYFILKRWISKRKITSQIKQFNLTNQRLANEEIDEFLIELRKLNEEDIFAHENRDIGKKVLGEEFKGITTDWNAAKKYLTWMESFSNVTHKLCITQSEELIQKRSHLLNLINKQPEMFSVNSNYFKVAAQLRNSFRDFANNWHELSLFASPRKALCNGENSPGILISSSSMVASWKRAKTQLQPWCVWQLNKTKSSSLGLQGLVNSVEAGEVSLDDLVPFFEFSYKNWWVKKIIDNEALLSNFSGATHEHKIFEFKKIDANFQKLTQEYIVAKLRGKIPRENEIKGELSSEIAFLRREAQKQRQHKSIRQVINQAKQTLPRVKPCLLMSPLSVAQYLDAGHPQFDVVIFDEASQIPTWDAVGAIARGKQLVCVGDPKQLPPTNFFNAADSDGVVNEDDIEEMESILDECLSIGMMTCTLDWHYRSKSEGLITFSNMQYYENRLITFPSPVTEDQSVTFVDIGGIYDAGKSRTNRKEADAIVDAVVEHYLSGKGKSHSVGVITFNAPQQSLIEKLIDAKRMEIPKFEIAISDSQVEPYFVKNLENVQGDERDVILFSITFGKDINGKTSMNFGPMNKEGGHRRLNVAASRARYQVKIFSSLRPEHIDLSRTKARGVADLKAYLDFAINGPRVLAKQALPTGREPDSPFEVAVINKLRDNGWEVHPQVGVSGYRLDLAVVNPHARGRYLLGVECDGATYHSAANARDRDRLRQMILEGLGWNIHRIWSTDWWINPEIPMKKLLDKLNQLEQIAAADNDN